ncbi:MAG: hypothetical protein DI626_10430 [Micavibrio aeruginosavorus]|uniref:LysM domain-containing protein n=1 Tax=Micavibrio aeruginosavorus TaxID=349221 RepID=A0A2W4ZLA6_9BACT|nr:MAG: hypothetical protein DI626_10430 [Micavibrio aeruginosavorus]
MRLLYLDDHIGARENLFGGADNLRPARLIIRIGKVDSGSRTRFHQHLVPVRRKFPYAGRDKPDTMLLRLDFLGDAHDHRMLLWLKVFVKYTKITPAFLGTVQQRHRPATQICKGQANFHIIKTDFRGMKTMAQPAGNSKKDMTQGQLFWNVYTNYQDKLAGGGSEYDYNREIITYLQSDNRFLSYIDQYLEQSGKTPEQAAAIRAEAAQKHEQSAHTLNTTSGYSTDVQAVSDNLYDAVERLDTEQLGGLAAEPENGITTTPVTEPSNPEVLPEQIRPEPVIEQPAAVASIPEQSDRRTKDDVVEIAPVKAEPEKPAEFTNHSIKKGDSLWKIAQEFYGLENPKDIMRAVDHIARLNGMGDGTKANHLSIGQVIKLPDSPAAPQGTPQLDWAALDTETKSGLSGKFASAVANKVDVAENIPLPVPRPDTLPKLQAGL